mmetsp:Transcript_9286/g.18996  ORF Transcript_9286/g.18996 Transcript_9286/m.18996 type:complete len:85 (-) Transcript_9286:294-548(-)
MMVEHQNQQEQQQQQQQPPRPKSELTTSLTPRSKCCSGHLKNELPKDRKGSQTSASVGEEEELVEETSMMAAKLVRSRTSRGNE